ncbi:amidohydrolase family protein [Nocardioides caeni]|uniref:amidohydrolase family protein n=1 Tax=Nocardioides caeni TaxID=574700 RepID=UPI0013050E0F|nr:amidohydrolase family protein [Nocardioides caeni]
MSTDPLLIRGALVDGVRLDCRAADGRIVALAPGLTTDPGDRILEARGGALLPGLQDHHVHVLAAAATRVSLDLAGGPLPTPIEGSDAADAADRGWLRVVGLGDDDVTRADLDAVWPSRPVRAQHRSGALWVLNSAATAELTEHLTDEERRTGRLWRERGRVAGAAERLTLVAQLAHLGRELAGWGVTGLTDATPDLDAATLEFVRSSVPQRVWSLGAVATDLPRKVVVTDHDDDTWERLRTGVLAARDEGRAVALHAVSRTALALAVAVLGEVGVVPGDRVEHAAVCDDATADRLAELGVVVVTQPSIPARRGRALLEAVDPEDRPWLWRMGGLRARGVDVVLSSDAPYGDPNPWTSIALSSGGLPEAGSPWLADETWDARSALGSYLTAPALPAGPERRVGVGAPADLCLLDGPLDEVLARVAGGGTTAPVRATVIGGRLVAQ